MARGKGKNGGNAHGKKRPIERYEHTDKKRINNPPVGLVTPETDPPLPTHKVYDYIEPVPSVKPGKIWITTRILIRNSYGLGRKSTPRLKSLRSHCMFTKPLTRARSSKPSASATGTAIPFNRRFLIAPKKKCL